MRRSCTSAVIATHEAALALEDLERQFIHEVPDQIDFAGQLAQILGMLVLDAQTERANAIAFFFRLDNIGFGSGWHGL